MLPGRLGAAGALVLAAAIAVTSASPGIAANADLAGRWEGTVQIPGSPLVIVLDLDKGVEGGWVGSVIVPGFGVKGAPLREVTIKDSEFSFIFKNAMGDPKLTGKLTADGTLSGSYEQGGFTLPFALKPAGKAQVDLPRQSTTISKELEGGWESVVVIGGFKLRLGLKLASGKSGQAEGQFTMIDQGNYTSPVDLICQDGDKVELYMGAVNFGYEGLIARSSDEFQGILRIGALEFPLNWHRVK